MKAIMIIFSALILNISLAQNTDNVLTRKLNQLVKDFRGDAGLYVRHLKTGQMVSIQADSVFPTASMIKIPITIGMFDKIERGEIAYHSVLTYKDSLFYPGEEDILGSFRENEKITLSKVMMLMITTSDNTASLWCQSLAGGGSVINEWLARHGFEKTRVNSRTPGRQEIWKKYGWGQTTPREMAELVVRIRDRAIISARASDRIYRNLTNIYWDSHALSQIPPYIQVASKQGAVDKTRAEVVLVNAPHGDYVFCVITKNQEDTSWESDNEGFVLLRNVSKLLWEHFEPEHDWKPAPQAEAWY